MKFLRRFLFLSALFASPIQAALAVQYTIVTILPAEQTRLFEGIQSGVQRFAKATGHQASVRAPTTPDVAQQIQIIEDAIAQQVNAICITPVSNDVDAVLQRARAQGIVVIGHNASTLHHIRYTLEPFEEGAYGVHLMTVLAARMQSVGEYAIVFGSRAIPEDMRRFEAALAVQKTQFPNMKLVTRGLEDYHDVAIAVRKTRELFRAFPKLQGLLCLSDTATQGAGQAMTNIGRQTPVALVGTGGMLEAKPAMRNENHHVLSFWEPADLGYALNMLAALLLDGETGQDGMSLAVAGYEDLRLRGNTLYGAAWIDVTP